jgi:hypothetical protein
MRAEGRMRCRSGHDRALSSTKSSTRCSARDAPRPSCTCAGSLLETRGGGAPQPAQQPRRELQPSCPGDRPGPSARARSEWQVSAPDRLDGLASRAGQADDDGNKEYQTAHIPWLGERPRPADPAPTAARRSGEKLASLARLAWSARLASLARLAWSARQASLARLS